MYVSYSYYQLDYIVYIELLYERKIKINMQKYFLDQQGCSHWRGQEDHASSPTSISEAIKVQSFQFKTSGILLSIGCSEIIRTRNFTIFTVYATIFGRFEVAFLFFQLHKGNKLRHVRLSEKVRYLTLDFLKSFSL